VQKISGESLQLVEQKTWLGIGSGFRTVVYSLIFVKFFINLILIFLHGQDVGISGTFILDGPSYIRGATSVAATGDFLNLEDIYHSPGFQILLAVPFILFGPNLMVVKLLNLFLFALIIRSVSSLGQRVFDQNTGLLAGLLVAYSPSLTIFTFILQYEIVAAFLLLLVCRLAMAAFGKPILAPSALFAGFFISLLGLIQERFLILAPLFFIYFLFRARRGAVRSAGMGAIAFIFGTASIVAPWSIYQSGRKAKFVIVSEGNDFRFAVGNNPNATGASFPYPTIVEPKGVKFIRDMPGKFLWLVKERFLYFWGFRENMDGVFFSKGKLRAVTDSWFRMLIPLAEKAVAGAYISLFLLGIGMSVRWQSSLGPHAIHAFYLVMAGVMIPPLVSISSARFSLPMVPYICLFQAFCIVRIAALIRSRPRLSSAP